MHQGSGPFCIIFEKVIYDIGTEILMLTSNLHNSTLRGRTEKSLSANYTIFHGASF